MIASVSYHVFLALGLVVSFEDWSQKRIRNLWIVGGLLWCAAGFCYLLWNSILGHQNMHLGSVGEYYLPWRYYPHVLVHLLLSIAAACTFWRLSIWPAGDAKLYILFSFFIALIDPNIPGFPLLLFLLLLVNIFVPAGLVFAAETVLRAALRMFALWPGEWRKWLKARAEAAWLRFLDAWPYRYDYLMLAVNLFALFYLMQAAQSRCLRLPLGPFWQLAVFLLMFVVWGRLAAFLRNKTVGILALAALALATISAAWFWRLDVAGRVAAAARMTVNFGVFLSLARLAFYWFIERDSLRELRPEHIEPGVVLSDETWEKLAAEKGLAGLLGERYTDGLSDEEAGALKAWLAGRREAEGYTVYQTIPFAAWIFMGALLTLSSRGNVVCLLVPHLARARDMLKTAVLGWLS